MAIEIEYGDEVLEFPDGTSDAVIKTAMQKYHAKKSVKPPSINSGLLPEEKGFDQVKSPSLPPLPLFAKLEKNQYTNEGNQNRPGVKKEELFPRTAKSVESGESYPKQVLGAGLDVATLPGRALASIPDGGESLKDIEGERFLGKVLRHPATAAMTIAAPFTGGATLAQLFGMGAVGAGATQIENMSKSQEKTVLGSTEAINPLEAVAETGLNVIGGKAGQMAGQYVAKPALRGIQKGFNTLGDFLDIRQLNKVAKPTPTMKERGFKKEVLKEYGIGGPIEKATEKTNELFNAASTNLKTALAKNPAKTVDVEAVLLETPAIPGYKAETEALVRELRSKLPEFGGQGLDKDLLAANEFKRFVGSQIDSWGQSDAPYKEGVAGFLKTVYKNINDKIIESADAAGPEIAQANKDLSKLIPIKTVLEKRIDQGVETPGFLGKTLSDVFGFGNMTTEAAMSLLGGVPGMRTGFIVGKNVAEKFAPKFKSPDKSDMPPELSKKLMDLLSPPEVQKLADNTPIEKIQNAVRNFDIETGVNTSRIKGIEGMDKNRDAFIKKTEDKIKELKDLGPDIDGIFEADNPDMVSLLNSVNKKFPKNKSEMVPTMDEIFGDLKIGDRNLDEAIDIYNKSKFSETGNITMADLEKFGNISQNDMQIITERLFPLIQQLEKTEGKVTKATGIDPFIIRSKINELKGMIDFADSDPEAILKNIQKTGNASKEAESIFKNQLESGYKKFQDKPVIESAPIKFMENILSRLKDESTPRVHKAELDALRKDEFWNKGWTLGELMSKDALKSLNEWDKKKRSEAKKK